jgi:predicted enzyme related to lactoylglutathione lyase
MMSQSPTRRVGQFVWRELMTSDAKASTEFYAPLFGWSVTEGRVSDRPYHTIRVGDRAIGGMATPPCMEHIKPSWLSYLSVDLVDATAQRAKALGGKVPTPPADIAGVGRFAIIIDPAGASIAVYRSLTGDLPRQERPQAGEFCWEQLDTADTGAAKAFYTKVLGWGLQPSRGGDDEVFVAGDVPVASVSRATLPAWLTYVVVADLDATRARAIKLGGKVLVDEVAVPEIGRFSVLADPASALVCAFRAA